MDLSLSDTFEEDPSTGDFRVLDPKFVLLSKREILTIEPEKNNSGKVIREVDSSS